MHDELNLIFGKADVREAVIIKWTLYCFEAWSELKINFNSSLICLGEKILSIFFICSIFGCKEERFPIKYLGIPIKLGKLSKEDWNLLFDAMERRLEVWRTNIHLIGSRVVLLNAVLSLIPFITCLFSSYHDG